MDKQLQELIEQIAKDFYIKSSKGNYLAVSKHGDKWVAQGKEVKRQQDIDYLNKQYENTIKDLTREYNAIIRGLEGEIWDSGNLSIPEQKILDFLLEKGICKRTPGVPGEHDTANGVAKWIYSINEDDEEERRHRLRNRKKSDAAKLAWKRHHYSYAKANRKKEHDNMNKDFYSIAKELHEATLTKDNVFDLECEIDLQNISGGFGLKVDKDSNVSISTILNESGAGNYKLVNTGDLKSLYNDVKDDLLELAKTIDTEIQQIVAKHGLKSTK